MWIAWSGVDHLLFLFTSAPLLAVAFVISEGPAAVAVRRYEGAAEVSAASAGSGADASAPARTLLL